jgi:hypothetical protein
MAEAMEYDNLDMPMEEDSESLSGRGRTSDKSKMWPYKMVIKIDENYRNKREVSINSIMILIRR